MRLSLLSSCLVVVAVAASHNVAAQEEVLEPAVPRRGTIIACPTLQDLGYIPRAITEIRLNANVQRDRLPDDCASNLFSAPIDWQTARTMETEFNWAASELYHQPAYWDDPILERYGQTYHPLIQPWASGAHFFGTFPLIPYKMGIDRTHDRIYTLGYYRPGSPTPCLGRRLPLEADAAGFETAAWLALIFLLP